jgi:succinoglycan biosynthesis transport protein ExoP
MESQSTTDVSDYIAALKRRRKLLAYIMLPIAGIAVALALGLPNKYLSSSLIEFSQAEISGEVPNANPNANRGRQEKSYVDQYVTSLSDTVLARDNLKAALEKPGLPVALKPAEGEEQSDVIGRIVDGARVDTVRVPVLDPDSGREREIVSAFTVGYKSTDPEIAHSVALWLTKAFMQASRDILRERAQSSAQFYKAEGDQYAKQIGALESKLADFKGRNFGQLPELTGVNMGVMDRIENELANVELQLSNLRQNRMFFQAQLDQQKSQSPDANLLATLEAEYAQKQAIYDPDHPDLINLRRQIESLRRGGPAMADMPLAQQLEAQKAILSETRQRYSADHPDVKRIQRQIESLQARIARGEKADTTLPATQSVQTLKTQINGVDTQIAGLQGRGTELRTKLDQIVKRVESTPEVEREYQSLTRDLQLARTKYDELLKSRMDAELTDSAIAGGRSDELRLVTPAALPSSPAKPGRLAIGAVGIILSVILALAAVVLTEAMDQSVRGSRDVKRVLSVAPLAVIPRIQDAASVRRQRFRMAVFASCAVIGSFIVVMTMRSLS